MGLIVVLIFMIHFQGLQRCFKITFCCDFMFIKREGRRRAEGPTPQRSDVWRGKDKKRQRRAAFMNIEGKTFNNLWSSLFLSVILLQPTRWGRRLVRHQGLKTRCDYLNSWNIMIPWTHIVQAVIDKCSTAGRSPQTHSGFNVCIQPEGLFLFS